MKEPVISAVFSKRNAITSLPQGEVREATRTTKSRSTDDERPKYEYVRYLGKVTCPQCDGVGYAELGEVLGVQVVHILHKGYHPELRLGH
jgi:hypothetical protein